MRLVWTRKVMCVCIHKSEEGSRNNSNRGGWSRRSWEISFLQLNQVINETWLVLGLSSLFRLVDTLSWSLNCRNWNVYRNTPAFHEGKFEKRSVIMQISALVSQRGGPRLDVRTPIVQPRWYQKYVRVTHEKFQVFTRNRCDNIVPDYRSPWLYRE